MVVSAYKSCRGAPRARGFPRAKPQKRQKNDKKKKAKKSARQGIGANHHTLVDEKNETQKTEKRNQVKNMRFRNLIFGANPLKEGPI